MSPLKNIMTQSVFASVIGPKTYVEGLARLADPEVQQYLDGMQFRLEFPIVEEFDMSTRNMMRRVAEFFLHVFKYSDHCNVMVAGSGALVAWKRLEQLIEKHPNIEDLTINDVADVLFEGKDLRSLKLDEQEVLERVPLEKWSYQRREGFKGITQEVFDMIQNNEMDSAKDFFIRTMVSLSQWQYGKGGSPAMLRNSVTRFLFMYSTWWMNYGEFLGWVGNPKNGLVMRGLGMLFAQFILVSILSGLGIKAYDWIGTGPFPEKVGFTGPGVQLLNQALDAARRGALSGQAEVKSRSQPDGRQPMRLRRRRTTRSTVEP
jgi:hypothetical protein